MPKVKITKPSNNRKPKNSQPTTIDINIPFPPKITHSELIAKTVSSNNKPGRTPNAFITYKMIVHRELKSQKHILPIPAVSKLASILWNREPDHVKRFYKKLAHEAKQRYKKSCPFFISMDSLMKNIGNSVHNEPENESSFVDEESCVPRSISTTMEELQLNYSEIFEVSLDKSSASTSSNYFTNPLNSLEPYTLNYTPSVESFSDFSSLDPFDLYPISSPCSSTCSELFASSNSIGSPSPSFESLSSPISHSTFSSIESSQLPFGAPSTYPFTTSNSGVSLTASENDLLCSPFNEISLVENSVTIEKPNTSVEQSVDVLKGRVRQLEQILTNVINGQINVINGQIW